MSIISSPVSSSKNKKKKWASAEQKRNALALEKSWEELKNKYKTKLVTTKPVETKVIKSNIITDTRPKSLNSWVTGPVSSKPNQKYTGDMVKGIVVQHKSCLQPVFNQQEAIDSAKMRRG